MKRLTSRVLVKASPLMLAVSLGLLGPAALNDEDDDGAAVEAAPRPDASDAGVVPDADAFTVEVVLAD